MSFDISRLVQVVFRLLSALLVGKAGMDAAQAGALAQPAAELVGAVGLFVVDLIIHTKRFGALQGKIGNLLENQDILVNQLSTAASPTTTTTTNTDSLTVAALTSNGNSTMGAAGESTVKNNMAAIANSAVNTVKMLLLVALLGLIVFSWGGCANSEKGRLGQGYVLVRGSAETLSSLVQHDQVKAKDAEKLLPAYNAALAALDAWTAAIAAGDATNAAKFESSFNAALTSLDSDLTALQKGR